MPAHKKVWVFDGHIEQYPDSFMSSVHGKVTCVDCHGGDNTASTRAAAHDVSWQAIPGSDSCENCHAAIATSAIASLHTNLGGYVKVLDERGFDFTDGTVSKARFDQQCTKCHVANSETKPACGFCHVSVPTTANGGLLNGHLFRKTPDIERNCTACHGSRIKDEFYGLNGALITRNGLGMPAPKPDVHFALTQALNEDGLAKGCTVCHSAGEMHGEGAPDPANSGDRYTVSSAPACTDCHENMAGSNTLHRDSHLSALSCQTCHAQPYKNCFGCHTDVDTAKTGLPYYNINDGDPTLAARGQGATPDALMSFRIGKNPRADRPYKFAVLRHVPVDKDLFTYAQTDPQVGLIPDLTAQPMWKYASPHNIQRIDTVTGEHPLFDPTDCSNCHDVGYSNLWLTDPVLDSEGWLEPDYEADETAANASVLQAAPMQYNTSN